MQLSDLVNLRNLLSSVSTVGVAQPIEILDAKISAISGMSMHADYQTALSTVLNRISGIEENVEYINYVIPKLIDEINQEIDARSQTYFKRGYTINGLVGSNSTDVHTERTVRLLPMHDDTRSEIINALRKKTDWHYPALEIGPGDGEWTSYMTASDPLYLIDVHPEFINSTKSKFNEHYQKRLRTYLTGPWAKKSEYDLSDLPANQFGFVFAWNVFNYFPEFETTIMLEQCFNLIRPGGSMIFSYNNCDLVACAEYCEQGFRSWMTSSKLENICKKIGFNIIKNITPEETFSYIEIRKPGELTTVKAHQVLGKIINRNS